MDLTNREVTEMWLLWRGSSVIQKQVNFDNHKELFSSQLTHIQHKYSFNIAKANKYMYLTKLHQASILLKSLWDSYGLAGIPVMSDIDLSRMGDG